MNLRRKLALVLLMCGLAPLVAYALASIYVARSTLSALDEQARQLFLERAEQDGLTLIDTRGEQVRTYAESLRRELLVMASAENIQRACGMFGRAFEQYAAQAAMPSGTLEAAQQRLLAHYAERFLP